MQLTTQDGRAIPLRIGENTLGRGQDNAIVVSNLSVSRRHACLRWDGSVVLVSDNGSANGTWLDGRRLAPGEWAPCRPGAQLRFGDDLYVQVTPSPASPYPGATISPSPMGAAPVSRQAPAAPNYQSPPALYGAAAYPAPTTSSAPAASYAPAAASAGYGGAAYGGAGKGGVDMLLSAVDISLSRAKLTVALGGTIIAALVIGLAIIIAGSIARDGLFLAVLFPVLGAVAAWIAVTLTIGALTRMSLNDLTGRPTMAVREALQYAFRRLPEFALAPLALGVLVALVIMAEVVVMLIGRVGAVGSVITSLLFVPAVVLNLFLAVLAFFGGSLLFPIIVDRGRGVFSAISYLLALMRKAPGRVVFYVGMAVIMTWLATLVLWLLVLWAVGMTTAAMGAGAGASTLLGSGIPGLGSSSLLGQLLFGGYGYGYGSSFGSGGSGLAAVLLAIGAFLVLAVASAFPLVLQVAMGSAAYLNVKDEVSVA